KLNQFRTAETEMISAIRRRIAALNANARQLERGTQAGSGATPPAPAPKPRVIDPERQRRKEEAEARRRDREANAGRLTLTQARLEAEKMRKQEANIAAARAQAARSLAFSNIFDLDKLRAQFKNLDFSVPPKAPPLGPDYYRRVNMPLAQRFGARVVTGEG